MPAIPHLLPFLLSPFAMVYSGIVRLRNLLYDKEVFSVYEAPIPVICVGNLSVGGTGKTPQVEYLARLLQPRKIAILSRGYKRATKGFVLADAHSSATTLGDEPFQYTQSLPGVLVAVCEKRKVGIQQLLKRFPDLEVILLDDAFQHRAVKASKYLLLTDFNRLFTQDYLLPMGRLREPRTGSHRAQAVVVTKCPGEVSLEQQAFIRKQIQRYTSHGTPIFFSQIVYGAAVPVGLVKSLGKRLILVTGIANAHPLVQHLSRTGFELVRHFEWADHAAVTRERVEEVVAFYRTLQDPQVSILMTQKDAVKWQAPELESLWRELPVFYLPITNTFAPQEASFDATMSEWVLPPGSDFNS
ncbi:tetraacyldisaccharide 4'-kinase [Rufibacter hautae]|uniref:Tetraacyldisaccharide 4'-kinase n=1 Tax=Rufibacter hautae TaxID=2595005 RepID=A0A5B6TCY4_9BACT|nr:tetraacyldisaccharide 4'-kinase [Rufibacter hautae]KAA3438317.1 tetraacyldisaccharide 4'-kinase [Rufibacter hautae]